MRLVVACVLVAACGSSSSPKQADATIDSPKPIDAPKQMDAPAVAATVKVVTCPTTPDASIMTASFAFTPSSVTIAQNQIVQITTEAIHDVVPGHSPADTTLADPGLAAGFGATTCFQFTKTGTFGFHCGAHPSMNGTVTVQ